MTSPFMIASRLAALLLVLLVSGHNPAHAEPKFPQFPRRATQNLNGSWHFAWLGAVDLARLDPASISFADIAAVPGVFDTSVENFGNRGTGVYRREVHASAGRQRLLIGGLGLYAKVWWDEIFIGEIRLPYATVQLDFMNPADGAHTLTIAVDNRFSETTAPLFKPNYDFYAYGGIYRGVALQSLPSRRIERVRISTLDLQPARVRVSLDLAGVPDGVVAIAVACNGGSPSTHTTRVKGDKAELELAVPEAKLWSPKTPHLSTLLVELDEDRLIDRFGLRTIAVADRRLLLNGQEVRLKGANRHESHPEFGPVQNTQLMLQDIQLVRSLGGNFIRCVHYQHDPEFYELCDEAGMLVWAESLGWGLDERALQTLEPLLLEETRILGQIVANHPSVIIAGFLNECASDKKSVRPLYEKLAATLRSTAPGSLVSYASNRLKRDVCFGVCDVVSVNYYPGWITGTSWSKTSIEPIKPFIDDLAAWFDSPENGDVYAKPLLTAETGCCGVYGVRDRALAQWSEDYQAAYLRASLQASMGNPRFCGVTVWQLFDTRSYVNTGEVRGKFRGFNNAGLADEYRRPKLAFDEVQSLFRAAK